MLYRCLMRSAGRFGSARLITEFPVEYHRQEKTAKAMGETIGAGFGVSRGTLGQDGVPEGRARGSLTK